MRGVDLNIVRKRLEEREERLSPFAAKTSTSRGRARAEEPSPLRTEFQRDRDRILHHRHRSRLVVARRSLVRLESSGL